MIDRILVENYFETDWKRLLRADLGNGQLTQAEPYFGRIRKMFDQILNNPITQTLSDDVQQRIEAQLNDFIQFVSTEILNFSDVSLREDKVLAVKNKEWQIANNLSTIISYLSLNEDRGNVKDAEVILNNAKAEWEKESLKIKSQNEEISKTYQQLEESIKLAGTLDEKSEVIKTAIDRAEEWIRKNEEAVQLILKSNATDSAKKAEEHVTFKFEWVGIWIFKYVPYLRSVKQPSISGSFFWMIGSVFSGFVVMTIISYFIYLDYSDHNSTVSSVLLRLSAVLIPAYFTFFAAQQFLSHRRLYEAYRFKDVTLQTMINLRKQNPGRDSVNEFLLHKAVEVIFTEPRMFSEVKYDKQIITELLDLAKNRLG